MVVDFDGFFAEREFLAGETVDGSGVYSDSESICKFFIRDDTVFRTKEFQVFCVIVIYKENFFFRVSES